MKNKRFLIFATAFLSGAISAQQSDRPVQTIQRTEAVAMRNLTGVIAPQYPDDMRKQVTGKVVVKILIDNEGNVREASLLTGDPRLVEATVTAVKRWKFRPYILNDERVEVETTATVEYSAESPYVVMPKPFPGPRKLRVSQGVMESNLLRKVAPDYPQEAKASHIQGDVILQATIDREGNISELKAVSGHPLLVEAAMKALRQWKYKPYFLNGEPVEVETTIKVQFHM